MTEDHLEGGTLQDLKDGEAPNCCGNSIKCKSAIQI